jgi:hypothetical protein
MDPHPVGGLAVAVAEPVHHASRSAPVLVVASLSPHVSAEMAVLLLHQEAVRTGDARLRIKAATLRQWVRRRHITYDRGRGGYDVVAIVEYVTKRPARGQRPRRPVDPVQVDVSPSPPAPPVCPHSESA